MNAIYLKPGLNTPLGALVTNDSGVAGTITYVDPDTAQPVTVPGVPKGSLADAPCVLDFGDLNGGATGWAIGAYYPTTNPNSRQPAVFTARNGAGEWSGITSGGIVFVDLPGVDLVGADPTLGCWIPAPTKF